MSKISINLLPPEILAQEVKKARFYKIQAAGVGVVLVLVFLTSLTLALRILQSRNISEVQVKLAKAEQRISDLKSTETSLMLLKNRLMVVNQYFGVSSQQTEMYKLIEKLTPLSVAVNSITVGKGGDVTLQAFVSDPVSLDEFVNNLTSVEWNENKISQVSVDNLNRGRDGVFRISLKITSQ
ncbi:MAG: hypothetical protein ACD_38C00036G0003 [uncultured bacterium]|uniref:Fimbrial assembly family protein n=1 Tax=Candidatus Daviesbacteria bacterium GW2011_GWC2_40_12 TaxID=1618431 RepID=A0A0G0QMM5_9BACT|nr:MAG: hypothetical protein ACD_38C00036G0003 [uncultured bacterium]KKQ81662.1 MAG: hypothetical protein UT04_C0067G0011 [Candidatus Daviesbacteria bacterium GW2011_GWF2_38_7]KKR15624.1 MAG: hypothetical protein UT45_C0017G0010 [Candidatus Daviesbacteria bacterium GW2011_GWA2_39_33]KKR24393.1 MAG: hypothetical protein UT54_C0021G0009 [Candidatus Daviesbacteria bacterium GW2011_GWB1_39_5]KKR41408.1 MAG: hypothetical protein UT77_C0012G0035 [Candidatus Daviesbacteria bacterium GW2011_GWC2_40_12]